MKDIGFVRGRGSRCEARVMNSLRGSNANPNVAKITGVPTAGGRALIVVIAVQQACLWRRIHRKD